jgi:hypothetical protein
MSIPFRQDRSPVEKPGPASRTFWAGCPESAARGGLLFWLLFSWPRKRKVTRPPQEDETLCTSKQQIKARASRLKSLPQEQQKQQEQQEQQGPNQLQELQ